MSFLGSIVLPLILGAIGWIALEFLGRPVRKFFDLRSQAKALLSIHNDPFDEDDEPRKEFKELGAMLVAFDSAEVFAASLVRRIGFNPSQAGDALLNLANDWGKANVAYNEYRKSIKSGLRLKDKPRDPNW